MKKLLLAIFVLAILADLFIWMMATASGHKLPSGTNTMFIIIALILAFFTFLIKKHIR